MINQRQIRAAQDEGSAQAHVDATSGADPSTWYGTTTAPSEMIPSRYRDPELRFAWSRSYAQTMVRIAGRRQRGEPDEGIRRRA